MYQTEVQVRVRYAETDQMGYVYYGNYAAYYEVARVECLRKLGFTYKKLEEEGVMMPVLDLQSKFLKPATYDDLLRINVCIPETPSLKIKFQYKIFNEKEEILNTGETILVFVNMGTNKICRVPPSLDSLLRPFFKDTNG